MVVVIVGVLAAFAVPRFTDSVERSKSSEAFNFQATIHAAPERYHARQGIYASRLAALDARSRRAATAPRSPRLIRGSGSGPSHRIGTSRG